MTDEEAKFERSISDQIVREVAKELGYTSVRFRPEVWHKRSSIVHITRLFGQRLVIPQDDEWDFTLTVTLWYGTVKADLSASKSNSIFMIRSVHLEYDIGDPEFISDLVKQSKRFLSKVKNWLGSKTVKRNRKNLK